MCWVVPVQFHSTFIEYETQLHWTARIVIRACLLLSLWNVPLPWLHKHCSYGAAEKVVGNTLPAHLQQFHADKEVSEEGWHLHFVYLGAEHSSDPQQQNLPLQNYFLTGESATSLTAGNSLSAHSAKHFLALTVFNEAGSLLRIMPPGAEQQNCNLSGQPVLSTGSLRDLTSVSRC